MQQQAKERSTKLSRYAKQPQRGTGGRGMPRPYREALERGTKLSRYAKQPQRGTGGRGMPCPYREASKRGTKLSRYVKQPQRGTGGRGMPRPYREALERGKRINQSIIQERSPTTMPDHVYEVVAQGARYWFLFWMALIVWRSWRWYRKDRRAAKKRLKLLPDAGFVGEMVVVDGGGVLEKDTVFPVPREGTLGMLRTNDLCVPSGDIARRHLWFRFEDRKGLLVEPFGKNQFEVDGQSCRKNGEPLYMAHGSWLTAGGVCLRLRLFAGFESVGRAQRRYAPEPEEQAEQNESQQQGLTQEQYQQMWQQWQMQQQYAQQQAYQQGYQQAMAQQVPQPEDEVDYWEEWPEDDDPDSLPYDMAQIAREEGMVDNSIFMRPAGESRPQLPEYEAPETEEEPAFYPPETDEEPDWAEDADEDMTDAAAPPRSAYVGRDEAERAKRAVWDKYFGGRPGQ